jgi:tripartite-type tricarboxylate transporter receptor subunit TctC
MNYVISTELVPFVLTQRKDPPWGSTSLDDMVAYAKENPGEIKYICFGAGSGRDISWAFYAETLGIEVDDSACGDGSQGIAAIIGSGEGDMALNTPDAALVGYEAGVTDVIFVTGTQPAPEPWSDVPNGADIGIEDDPYGVTRGWAVSKETPDLHRAWLHELFRAGGETDELQEARNTLPGITLFSKDHDETRAIAEAALEYTTPILQDLGLYVDPTE